VETQEDCIREKLEAVDFEKVEVKKGTCFPSGKKAAIRSSGWMFLSHHEAEGYAF
jgi:hypothetical protein